MKHVLLALFMAATLLIGCKGSGPEPTLPTVASIVTYEGSKDGVAEFSYVESDESTIRLYAAWSAPEDFTPGKRALIYYQAAEYGVDNSITLNAVIPIPMGEAEVVTAIPEPGAELQNPRAWRSGQWLNLAANVTFSGDLKSARLLVKEETMADPIPQAIVIIDATENGRAPERQFYATWRIGDILAAPGVEGLKIQLNESTEIEIK